MGNEQSQPSPVDGAHPQSGSGMHSTNSAEAFKEFVEAERRKEKHLQDSDASVDGDGVGREAMLYGDGGYST